MLDGCRAAGAIRLTRLLVVCCVLCASEPLPGLDSGSSAYCSPDRPGTLLATPDTARKLRRLLSPGDPDHDGHRGAMLMLMGGLSPSPYMYTHTPRRHGAAAAGSASSFLHHTSFFSPSANSACVTPGSSTPGAQTHPAAQLNVALRAAHGSEPCAGKANLLRRMNSKLGASVRARVWAASMCCCWEVLTCLL